MEIKYYCGALTNHIKTEIYYDKKKGKKDELRYLKDNNIPHQIMK